MGVLKACIVITGGPCAGKTVTVLEVKNYLEDLGYHVLLLNECATELILGGIKPFGDNPISVFDFQNEIFNLQRYKEKRYLDIIEKLPDNQEVIMLLDRGIWDSKAYLNDDKLWNELLKKNKMTEADLGKNYDLVLHLETVAKNIQNEYNLTSNLARFEDVDNAIDVDKRIREVWKNTKNVKVIKPTELVEEKIALVKEIIREFLETRK